VPVDVLSYGISYPQFVEVLLCMMAGRATALLEPEVKQLRPLTMDKEMQVRLARYCLGTSSSSVWHQKQLCLLEHMVCLPGWLHACLCCLCSFHRTTLM
jgi:hypothetical protein